MARTVADPYAKVSAAAAFEHDGPVPVDAAVNRTELAMLASVAPGMPNGFKYYIVKAILSGSGELVDLTRTNLRH